MKLVVITAIAAFENDIKQLLKKAAVSNFSHQEVSGYQHVSAEALDANWFASEAVETPSVLFYAFVAKGYVELLFNLVEDFNSSQETASRVHVAILQIEKSN
ncbi:MAG: hypothetical protein ACKOWL_04085 [Sphingobacteriaceae bacterium]